MLPLRVSRSLRSLANDTYIHTIKGSFTLIPQVSIRCLPGLHPLSLDVITCFWLAWEFKNVYIWPLEYIHYFRWVKCFPSYKSIHGKLADKVHDSVVLTTYLPISRISYRIFTWAGRHCMQLHVHVATHHYFDAHAYMNVSVYFTHISVLSHALFYNLLILASKNFLGWSRIP